MAGNRFLFLIIQSLLTHVSDDTCFREACRQGRGRQMKEIQGLWRKGGGRLKMKRTIRTYSTGTVSIKKTIGKGLGE